MNLLQEKFGARIKEIRRSKNLTQEVLSEMIGIDIPNLSNIERGKKFVSATTLTKIAKALNVSEKELFDFEHINTKDKLTKKIFDLIDELNLAELEYLYKNLISLKELKKNTN